MKRKVKNKRIVLNFVLICLLLGILFFHIVKEGENEIILEAWSIERQINASDKCVGFSAEELSWEMFNKTGEEAGYNYSAYLDKNITNGEFGCGDFSYYENIMNLIKKEYSNVSGDKIRIGIGGGIEISNIVNVSICERSREQSCVDSTWTKIYFNGENIKTIYPNNLVLSDWVDFKFDENKDYLITFYWVNGPLCYGISENINSYYWNNLDWEESIAQWIQKIEVLK